MYVQSVKSLSAIGVEYYVCQYQGHLYYGNSIASAISNAVVSVFMYA